MKTGGTNLEDQNKSQNKQESKEQIVSSDAEMKKSENQGSETNLDSQTENNQKKVEKIDLSEIQKIKEQDFSAKKTNEETSLPENVTKIDPEELKKAKDSLSDENSVVEQVENHSQPENVEPSQTQSETLGTNSEEKKTTEEINKEEQKNEFEGMSEEEISAELERRKRLADLKLKYSEENKNPNDVGEYKKSLDFSSNFNIKHFKMHPPKKTIIIILSIVFVLVALAVSLTVYFLKKPPAPATLLNSKISQSTIYHYVGEQINLTGITVEQLYSDGTKKTVLVDETKVTQKSSNIANDLTILSYLENTYLEFTIDGKKLKLNVKLDELRVTGIKKVIHPTKQYSADSKIKFDTILILANIKDRENKDYEPKRISAKDATFKIEGQDKNLLTDNEGILLYTLEGENNVVTLPSGNYTIIVTIEENGTTFSSAFEIEIFNASEEENVA